MSLELLPRFSEDESGPVIAEIIGMAGSLLVDVERRAGVYLSVDLSKTGERWQAGDSVEVALSSLEGESERHFYYHRSIDGSTSARAVMRSLERDCPETLTVWADGSCTDCGQPDVRTLRDLASVTLRRNLVTAYENKAPLLVNDSGIAGYVVSSSERTTAIFGEMLHVASGVLSSDEAKSLRLELYVDCSSHGELYADQTGGVQRFSIKTEEHGGVSAQFELLAREADFHTAWMKAILSMRTADGTKTVDYLRQAGNELIRVRQTFQHDKLRGEREHAASPSTILAMARLVTQAAKNRS